MNNIYQLPTQGRVDDEASEWLAKLDRGLSADEERALKTWFRQSTEHQATLLKLASLWDRMDNLAPLSDLFPRPVQQQKGRWRYAAAAACALFAIVLTAWQMTGPAIELELSGWLQPDDRATPSFKGVYETAIGTQHTASLPDGSVLVLNTNSLVKVLYSRKQRLLTLERGEMNIEVAHDAQRPLTVMAGNKSVQAVGTAFNVQIINDSEVELIVTDGTVLVVEREDAGKPIEPLSGRSTVVIEGEKVVFGAKQKAIAKVSASDISAQLSWRQGNLVFQGETLAEAVVELSRYTRVKFKLADDSLGDIRIGGRFKAGDVEGLRATLRENFNIDSECPDDETVLLKAR